MRLDSQSKTPLGPSGPWATLSWTCKKLNNVVLYQVKWDKFVAAATALLLIRKQTSVKSNDWAESSVVVTFKCDFLFNNCVTLLSSYESQQGA